MARTATVARFNFEYAIGDVRVLMQFHDQRTGGSRGRPERELEVLKRSALILVVTAWESYVEDTLRDQFQERLESAKSPAAVSSAFNAAADTWLQSAEAKPPRLADWTGRKWKARLVSRLEEEIELLNTPDSARVRRLSKRYLALDVTSAWIWQNTTSESACDRLDALIALRGQLVHRGRELFERRQSVKKSDVLNGRALVNHLVRCTDVALGVAPSS